MMCSAIGGGLIEVLISPIVEATPSSGAKETAMSLLHSFYCWGHVAVVIFSTIGFQVFSMNHWYYLPIIWSIVPILNIFLFSQVPINMLVLEEEQVPAKRLLSMKIFWLLFILMVCSGASEVFCLGRILSHSGIQAESTSLLLAYCDFHCDNTQESIVP